MSSQDPMTLFAIEAVVVLLVLLVFLGIFTRYQNQRIKRLREKLNKQPDHLPDLDLEGFSDEPESPTYRHHLNQALQHTILHYKSLRPDNSGFELHPDQPAEVQTTAMRLMFLHAEKQALQSTDEESFWQSIHSSLTRVASSYAPELQLSNDAGVSEEGILQATGNPKDELAALAKMIGALNKTLRQATEDSKHLATLNSELNKTLQNLPTLKDSMKQVFTAFGPNYTSESENAGNTLTQWKDTLGELKLAQQSCSEALTAGEDLPAEALENLRGKIGDLLWYSTAQLPEYQEQIAVLQATTSELETGLAGIRPKTQHHAFIEEMLKESRDLHHIVKKDIAQLEEKLGLAQQASESFSLLQE
ncbi:hypothetical protein ACKC9G_02750 [Pokkaliibacter sp. CJK22405]|uniref:hypothetical protein n=1 Tax=Pokkaliibacter sp. CJK22405 TaxID=3384615 RepID=UPI003984882C